VTRPKNKRSPGSEWGFTLPEVMITIVVMGMVLTIATSTWFRVIESRTVDSAANQLAAEMRLAHTRSTNELTDWRVQIFPDRVGPDQTDYAVKGPTTDRTYNRSLPEDSMVSSTGTELNGDGGGSRTLRFQSTGAVEAVGGFGDTDGDGEIRITVTVDGNPSRSLTVVPTTSRVKVVP
jgi:prepilin-type N-terminal cleavage/methylation domain-containing protein